MSGLKTEFEDETNIKGKISGDESEDDSFQQLEKELEEASEQSTSLKTEPPSSRGEKRPREEEVNEEPQANDDNEVDEEDDDEEDEEDEEEEEVSSKKRKRRRANQFIDIEAEVDDEEEDELDEDDEEAELLREQFISDDHRADAADGSGEPGDDRLHRQFDRRRQEAEDQDAEKLAETLKQRYRKTHTVYRGDTTASGTVSQKLLMPSINDPAIYGIRCIPGREKELVRKLYEKKRTLARSPNPLDILTVFQRDSFKGYIYIEAKKPEAIERALAGMVNVYAKQRILVPVREYPDLLKQVKSSDVELVPGIYVRITRGKYKGDLAVVDNLSENGLDVRCKLVPRLDYGKNDEWDKDGKRIKSKSKPMPRLFNEQEARMYDGDYLQPGRGPRAFVYRNEEYYEGFLFKDFKLNFIQTKDVHPRLEELDRFQTGSEEDGLDLTAIAASLKNNREGADKSSSSAFQPDDKVEIRRGEQAKTIGKVLSTSLNEVTITVTDSGDPKFVNQKLTVPASDLRKVFTAGDHVKIIEGKHIDETGLVIKIDNDSVVLLSDQTKEDVRVFANYLIKATDTSASGHDALGGKYDLKDLVQVNASTVGCIVRADKGIFEILSQDGRLISLRPSGIASKLELTRREQIATDRNGSTINVGDTVKEVLGDSKREGTIIHIYKNSLYIKSNDIIENLGIFVTNSLNVSTITTKGSMVSKTLGPDLNRMNPNLKLPAAVAANSGLRTRVGGRDKLINHNVVVIQGNYKGLMGKATDADDVYVRIELHTKSKKIKVRKDQVSVMIRGESIPYLRFIGAPGGGNRQPSRTGPSFGGVASGSGNGGGSTWGGGGASSWNKPRGGASAYAGTVGGASSTWGGAGGQTPSISGAGGASAWGGGKTPGGNASTWGKTPGGAASTWGSGGAAGGNSQWGASNGDNSTWGGNKNSGSAWGGNAGNNSGNGGNSTWGSGAAGGGNSTWGNSGGNSAWGGNKGDRSNWGGNSAWGSK
ncbi:transcription elongation factor Spt5p [[Candida] anglica]|uniref:Transcription elongation factor SPT5 n=1 Tax=[Candida] anglica TaxID=148631 RepID=A0ABP0EE64_9ASCO